MKILAGKVAIVTGASSGIGHAAAELFAAEGASVVVTARRQTELEALADGIERAGGRVAAIAGDVRDENLARSLVEVAVGRFGGLDIAFNNAGIIGAMVPFTDLSPNDWRESLEVNLTGAFIGARHQVPAMVERGGGSLIFTSSFVGYTVGMPHLAAYAAAKAGLIGLTKTLAAEFGPSGLRVNALLPGGTDTPMNFANAPDAGAEVKGFVEGLHAMKRIAAPEEIARAALYLAGDASSFVTGTAFLADGGVSIART